jgi:hypothetical protein
MPIEESIPNPEYVPQQIFELGQEVFDQDGKKLGKVQARFNRYILVERGGLFVKAYYVPLCTWSTFARRDRSLPLWSPLAWYEYRCQWLISP